jgi:hypothetical protein
MADQLMVTNGIADRIAELKAEAAAKTEIHTGRPAGLSGEGYP